MKSASSYCAGRAERSRRSRWRCVHASWWRVLTAWTTRRSPTSWVLTGDRGEVALPFCQWPPRRSGRRAAAGPSTGGYRRPGRGRGGGDVGVDAGERDALVAGEDGRADRTQQVDDRADLAVLRAQASPRGRVQAVERPPVRGEGLRHRRALPQPA